MTQNTFCDLQFRQTVNYYVPLSVLGTRASLHLGKYLEIIYEYTAIMTREWNHYHFFVGLWASYSLWLQQHGLPINIEDFLINKGGLFCYVKHVISKWQCYIITVYCFFCYSFSFYFSLNFHNSSYSHTTFQSTKQNKISKLQYTSNCTQVIVITLTAQTALNYLFTLVSYCSGLDTESTMLKARLGYAPPVYEGGTRAKLGLISFRFWREK